MTAHAVTEMRITFSDRVIEQIVRAVAGELEGVTIAPHGFWGGGPEPVDCRVQDRRLHLKVYVVNEGGGDAVVPVLADRIRTAVGSCTGMTVADVQVEQTEG